jgi:CMP-N-acetylneuraminic acid synthetase
MLKNKKILAIIPARGGSKGIPRKNIKLLSGKPLMTYTIEVALKSKYLDRVIVSTDDKEIAKISKKYGAEVIKRPKILAIDRAKTIDVIFHLLSVLKKEKYDPDVIVLLQPTSPLRIVKDIDNAIELFLKNKCESIISICESGHSPYWSFKIKSGYLTPILGRKYFKQRRQGLSKSYIPNGAIYISTPKNLFKYKSFYTNKILPYIMPLERSIDIDNETDFKLAELILKKK